MIVRRQAGAVALLCATASILGLSTAPAHATVHKWGNQGCLSGEVVLVTAKGDDLVSISINGNIVMQQYNNTIMSMSYNTQSRTASWRATSEGILDNNGTYAWCAPRGVVLNNPSPIAPV